MSDIDKQDLKQEAVPFFARYLEGQINFIEEVSSEKAQAVGGGRTLYTTAKYPSDAEDSLGGGGTLVTTAYPSDEDSLGGADMTAKYPSDGDDYVLE